MKMLLFFYPSKKYSFALVETWGPHDFQDDYLEVLYIDSAWAKSMQWVNNNVLWSVSTYLSFLRLQEILPR